MLTRNLNTLVGVEVWSIDDKSWASNAFFSVDRIWYATPLFHYVGSEL